MLAYVIRHAESVANANQDPCSPAGLDSALSPLGTLQAAALARRFEGIPIAAVYSSPFRRALTTAFAVADRLNLPIRVRPELCEFHHLPEGPRPDLALCDAARVGEFHSRVQPDPDWKGPMIWPTLDERFEELIDRVRRFAGHLKRRWPDPESAVIAFGHGMPIARLIEAWLTDQPGPSFRFIIDNAAVSALRHLEGVSSLVCLNEASHLVGIGPPAGGNFDAAGRVKARPPGGYW